MKKNFLSLGVIALSLTGILTGCGGSSDKGGEAQDPIDLGSSFNADYYPKKSENIVKDLCNGKKKTITLALNYEGNEAAWTELAKEYERLSGNWVTVDVKTFTNADLYTQNLQQQETSQTTEWDIVSGNLLANATKSAYNLQGIETSKNPYMGNKKWSEALETTAYKGDSTYTFNTENLLTAWFVNKNATQAAGITDDKACPTTWDGLLDNLAALKAAGYKYPLGLSLNNDSIRNSQFAWLLRIYGDYYFRNNYTYINKTYDTTKIPPKDTNNFVYNPADQDIESDQKCDRSYSRMFCTMLDDKCDYWCGPTSDVYKEFINQFYKLKEYIDPSAQSYTFNEVRTHFMAQAMGTDGKESPQIIIDYTGKGLQFMEAERLKGKVDFFDYPYMSSSYVPSNTILRDVGGSGGYLSIFASRGKEQIDLDKDFLKFIASPYGQSIYYRALSASQLAPQGLTTVKNDLVVIPDAWKTFFKSDKVKNTGKADKNKYLTFGVLGFDKIDYKTNAKDTDNAPTMWRKLLTGDGTYTVDNYNADWLKILLDAYPIIRQEKSGWPEDGYSAEHFDTPNYIKDNMN